NAPKRQAVWYELARLHTALRHDHDSTVCWANAVWHDGTTSSWYWDWFQAERIDQHEGDLTGTELDRLLERPHAPAATARMLTAYLSWAVSMGQTPSGLRNRLGAVMQLVEKQETFLPVRVAWLGWVALARLAGGDALTLARARDRLLDRLYEHGLRPDQDLPGFLRFAGGAAGERFALVRTHLLKLRSIVGAWIDKDVLRGGHTHAYADLLFAFGLACLRENRASQQLLLQAIDGLGERDEVHTWLLDAYEFRITQAVEGKGHAAPLPSDLLERLEIMDRTARDVAREQPELASHYKLQRYKIDRLREHSRILEPHERIDPYRHWRGRQDDELSHALAALPDIHDRERLLQRLTELLQKRAWKHSRSPEARILVAALELAPRLGETFACRLFDPVLSALAKLEAPLERALLLEKALFLAAHFDQTNWGQKFVTQFHQVIDAAHGSELANELETLLGEVFRGLRKLGMRDEISRLLERMADLTLQGRPLRSARGTRSDKEWARLLKVLLHVAAGWFYFGQPERAWPVMEEVRQLLFQGELIPIDQTALACAYVQVLGQATPHEAIPRLEELFLRIERVQDAFTTNTHYSLSRLDVIEAAVLALVHEDFLVDSGSRRWLDEDEFAVRQRIHADMRAALASG
ncbi:MAG TPA: hypothetical protein VFA18_02940, partial [Gemmataceae bacterium]|nr:hypothetical protein [Gemmataceae bacterium]